MKLPEAIEERMLALNFALINHNDVRELIAEALDAERMVVGNEIDCDAVTVEEAVRFVLGRIGRERRG